MVIFNCSISLLFVLQCMTLLCHTHYTRCTAAGRIEFEFSLGTNGIRVMKYSIREQPFYFLLKNHL